MNRTYKCYIDQELATKISCAAYLSESHEKVITSILTNPDLQINDELFNKYVDKHIEAYVYEQELKGYMEHQYVTPIPVRDGEIPWSLAYATGKLQVTIDDDTFTDDTESFLQKNGFERVV